jgi:hypothetical protein
MKLILSIIMKKLAVEIRGKLGDYGTFQRSAIEIPAFTHGVFQGVATAPTHLTNSH